MKCLSCKTGNMIESTNTYFAKLKNCYIIIERIENILSKIFIMDYSTAA